MYWAFSWSEQNVLGAVTGKVKQSSTIQSVLSTTGVLKCGVNEIAEKHLCNVYQGSMERIEDHPDLPVHEDHSYSVGSNVGFNHDLVG